MARFFRLQQRRRAPRGWRAARERIEAEQQARAKRGWSSGRSDDRLAPRDPPQQAHRDRASDAGVDDTQQRHLRRLARQRRRLRPRPCPFSSICHIRCSVAWPRREAPVGDAPRAPPTESAGSMRAARLRPRDAVAPFPSARFTIAAGSTPRSCCSPSAASMPRAHRPPAAARRACGIAPRSDSPSMSRTCAGGDSVAVGAGMCDRLIEDREPVPRRAFRRARDQRQRLGLGGDLLRRRRHARSARRASPPGCGADRSAGSATAPSPGSSAPRWWRAGTSHAPAALPASSAPR